MINPQWLELRTSRTNYHVPKSVRVIEVRLYSVWSRLMSFRVWRGSVWHCDHLVWVERAGCLNFRYFVTYILFTVKKVP